MKFKELTFKEYINYLNPNFGNTKLYNLYTNKGFWIYQDKYESLSLDFIKSKIEGLPKLTEWEKEYSNKHGYEALQKFNPSLYSDKLGLSISSCSYYSQETSQRKIASIKSFAVDVDFKKDVNLENYNAEQYFSEMFLDLEEIGLLPTLVECGHCFRMIYVFENAIKIPFKNNQRFINLFKKMVQTITDRINEEFDCNAEAQQINSYYRLPGSVNEKNLSKIKVIETGDFVDFDYFVDKFMDEKPENYQYAKKTHKKYSTNSMENRFLDLKKLIPFICVGKRELFLHITYQTLLSFMDRSDAISETMNINKLLSNPLNEKTIKSTIFTKRKYFYKNETIAEKLSLSDEFCSNLGLFTPVKNQKENLQRFREKERLNKIKKGKTKKQEIEKIINKLASEINNDNFDIKKFCNENKISKSTFYRYKSMIVIVQNEYENVNKEAKLLIDNNDVIVNFNKEMNENQIKIIKNIVNSHFKKMGNEDIVNNLRTITFKFLLNKKDRKKLKKENIYVKNIYVIRKL